MHIYILSEESPDYKFESKLGQKTSQLLFHGSENEYPLLHLFQANQKDFKYNENLLKIGIFKKYRTLLTTICLQHHYFGVQISIFIT